MTSKFQQSQVRPRLGGREREGPRGPSRGQSPPSTPPDSPHRDRAGAGGLARVRVHCSERQPPRSVRGLPERRLPGWGGPAAGKSLSPTPAATVDSPDPYSTETSGPEGARHSCRAAVALARLSRLHAQTPPQETELPRHPRDHSPGRQTTVAPTGKAARSFKGLPMATAPTGGKPPGTKRGFAVHRASLILHQGWQHRI